MQNIYEMMQIGLLLASMMTFSGSVGQVNLTADYCGGSACISNGDCGSGCYCSRGVCFPAGQKQN